MRIKFSPPCPCCRKRIGSGSSGISGFSSGESSGLSSGSGQQSGEQSGGGDGGLSSGISGSSGSSGSGCRGEYTVLSRFLCVDGAWDVYLKNVTIVNGEKVYGEEYYAYTVGCCHESGEIPSCNYFKANFEQVYITSALIPGGECTCSGLEGVPVTMVWSEDNGYYWVTVGFGSCGGDISIYFYCDETSFKVEYLYPDTGDTYIDSAPAITDLGDGQWQFVGVLNITTAMGCESNTTLTITIKTIPEV